MEEEKQNDSVQIPILGIEQNLSKESKPSNHYTYALNALHFSDEGEMNFLARENGTKLTLRFVSSFYPDDDYFVVGYIHGNDDTIYYFLVNANETNSEIGYVDKGNTYTSVVNFSDLNFSLTNPITGTYRLRLGCEHTIYWVEKNGTAPIRYFNFSNPQLFQDNLGNWELNKFNLFYSFNRPEFEDIKVITGGLLKSGSYNVAIQLVDANFNGTPWLYTTNPIAVYAGDRNVYHKKIIGSSNKDTDPVGGIPGTAEKSISVTVGQLDEDFLYYRLAFIEATGFQGEVTDIFVTPPIPREQTTYLYDGVTNGLTKDATLQDIKDKKIPFTAEILEQHDNRLIAAKIKGSPYEFCEFQKYASKIATAYTFKDVSSENQIEVGHPLNDTTFWFPHKNFQGWEVYALGIVYVFPSFDSPAYHIPGRPHNWYFDFDTQTAKQQIGDNEYNYTSWNDGEVIPFTKRNDKTDYETPVSNADVQVWQVRDTSLSYGADWGRMSYHENPDFIYVAKEDCNSDGTDGGYWGKDFSGQTLDGKAIRHHRFPSRYKVVHKPNSSVAQVAKEILIIHIESLDDSSACSGSDSGSDSCSVWGGGPYKLTVNYSKNGVAQTPVEINNISSDSLLNGEDFSIDSSIVVPNAFTAISWVIEDACGNDVTCMFDVQDSVNTTVGYTGTNTIRLLGIRFTNVEYPHPDIIGHYFVIAPRDEFNRTVLDCGFAAKLRQTTTPHFDYQTFSYFTHNNADSVGTNVDDTVYVFAPKYNFKFDALNADYIRIDNVHNLLTTVYNQDEYAGEGATFNKCPDTNLVTRQQLYKETVPSIGQLYPIEKQKDFDGIFYDDTFTTGKRVYNLSMNNCVMICKLKRDFGVETKNDQCIPYIQLGVNRQVHTDLFAIEYIRLHDSMFTNNPVLEEATIFENYGGDTFISEYQLNNMTMFKKKGSLITIIIVVILAAIVTVVTVGAGLAGLAAIAASTLITAGSFTAIALSIGIALAVAGTIIGITAETIKQFKENFNSEDVDRTVEDSGIQIALDDLTDGFLSASSETFVMEGLHFCFVESEINLALRQEYSNLNDSQNGARIYKYDSLNDVTGPYIDYFRDKAMAYDEDEPKDKFKWKQRPVPYPEVYHYNKDFSRKNLETIYLPIPLDYICCSDCLENFPNRVHYSEQSFQEEVVDQYRVFLPSNYKDVEGEFGHLTNVFKKSDKLFIHLERALYHLPVQYQTQITNELVTYIGTGEYFSLPLLKVGDDKSSLFGSQHRFGTFKSKYGYLFVSEIERAIYLMEGDEAPKPIHLTGIKGWSEEEIPLRFNRDWYNLFGENYPLNDNPYHPYGIGFISVYDNRNERYILTKKDYRALGDLVRLHVYFDRREQEYYITEPVLENTIIYYEEEFFILPSDSDSSSSIVFNEEESDSDSIESSNFDFRAIVTKVDIKNHELFENRSWTISYSKVSNSWISWHSYLPDMYVYRPHTFFAIMNHLQYGAALYEHNIKHWYGIYYSPLFNEFNECSFIVEMYFNSPLQNFTWESVSIHCKGISYDAVNDDYKEERLLFFNKAIFYNHRQSTGLQDITIKQSNTATTFMLDQITNTFGTITASNNENIWFINNIRDFVTAQTQSLFTKLWSEIQPYYPIDKVPNSTVINPNKDWKEVEMLRSKYLLCRFILDTNRNNRTKQLIVSYGVKDNVPSQR